MYLFLLHIYLFTHGLFMQPFMEESIIEALNHFRFNELERYQIVISDKSLNLLLKNEISWLRYGTKEVLDDSLALTLTTLEDSKTSILRKLLLGNHYSRSKASHLKALAIYKEALKEAQISENRYLIKELLFRLLFLLKQSSRGEDHILALNEEYINQLENLLKDEWIDQFRFAHLIVNNEMQKLELNPNQDQEKIREAFETMRSGSTNNLIFSISYHRLFGIYLEVFKKDYNKAYRQFSLAKNKAEKVLYYFIQKQIPEIKHSQAIVLFRLGEYNKAIPIFEALLSDKHFEQNQIAKMYVNDWLFKCYEQLGNFKKALYYFTTFKTIYDSLDRRKHARLILKMENQNKMKESKEALEKLSKENLSLQSQFYFVVPFAIGLVLISLILYQLYKKTQSKKITLEFEKESTLREVQKLKQLVIKNHIILKDKTKIYINDLMYIKAEDKYIRVFTSDGKNHLVRGRLTDLEEQLPPNFIRTHRSYITNRNFVKQILSQFLVLTDNTEIPVSRSFKKYFK